MVQSLRRLGFEIDQCLGSQRCSVKGLAGRIPAAEADLWLENQRDQHSIPDIALCSGYW